MYWASGNGVRPSLDWLAWARRGWARQGAARPGSAGHGLRWQHGGPTGLPCRLHWRSGTTRRGSARHGWPRPGSAWQGRVWATDGGTEGFGLPCHSHKGGHGEQWLGRVWRGLAWRGEAGPGMGCRQQHWGLRLPLLLSTEGRRGMPRQCRDGQGSARRGGAWLGKGCRQQHGASSEAPCCSLWRADGAVPGTARRGSAWLGGARFGTIRQGLTISARRAQVLPAGFTQHTSRHD